MKIRRVTAIIMKGAGVVLGGEPFPSAPPAPSLAVMMQRATGKRPLRSRLQRKAA